MKNKHWEIPRPKTCMAHTLYNVTLVLYNKGGTIQQDGCLITGYSFQMD